MIKKIMNKIQKSIDPNKYWMNQGATIGKGTKIGRYADLGTEPYLITIGNNVRVNSGVLFINHDGGVWVLRNLKAELKDIDIFGKIIIGDNVHIGTRAIIMPGTTIGSNCIIGCGALVKGTIPDNSIAVGIPARVIESIDEYEKKHIDDFYNTKNMSAKEKRAYVETIMQRIK